MKAREKIVVLLPKLIHLLAWGVVLLLPIFLDKNSGNEIDWVEYLWRLPVPLSFLILFYLNYLYLIDKYLFRKKVYQYIFINLAIIAVFSSCIYINHEFNRTRYMMQNKNISEMPPPDRMMERKPEHIPPPERFNQRAKRKPAIRFVFIFISRDIFIMSFIVGLAVAVKITRQWYKDDIIRSELEKSKTEAELKNLRNQINPHFLLNTLNNIYALITFDTTKAQQAVQGLSKLL